MGAILLAQLIWFLAGALVIASLLPLSKVPFGAIRGLAFPREQFFVAAIILAIISVIFLEGDALVIALIELLFVAVVQLVYVVKFTPVWKAQSIEADETLAADPSRQISLLTANVKKSNREYDRLVKLIKECKPDVVMAIEVDQEWIDALDAELAEEYEHWVRVPKDNGYGLCLMSNLPLSDTKVQELITEGVPSIRTAITLPCGEDVRLYVVHPEPPVVDHDTKGRDSEIALIGLQTTDDPLPAIVTGDLNDVAWSTTTRRFQRLSGLLDPRVGRGFYNTFSAFTILMRWPLDHLFHNARFRLVEMERKGKIGSDHFPMFFKLALANKAATGADPGDADAEEKEEVKEMISEEKSRKREAIGSDWEDEEEDGKDKS